MYLSFFHLSFSFSSFFLKRKVVFLHNLLHIRFCNNCSLAKIFRSCGSKWSAILRLELILTLRHTAPAGPHYDQKRKNKQTKTVAAPNCLGLRLECCSLGLRIDKPELPTLKCVDWSSRVLCWHSGGWSSTTLADNGAPPGAKFLEKTQDQTRTATWYIWWHYGTLLGTGFPLLWRWALTALGGGTGHFPHHRSPGASLLQARDPTRQNRNLTHLSWKLLRNQIRRNGARRRRHSEW